MQVEGIKRTRGEAKLTLVVVRRHKAACNVTPNMALNSGMTEQDLCGRSQVVGIRLLLLLLRSFFPL